MNTRTHSRRARRITAFALAVAAASLSACSSGGSARKSTIEERRTASPVDFADYSALGYQLDWRGFPFMSSGASEVLYVEPLGDVVGVLESGSVLSVIDDTNGSLRASPDMANSLRTFLGLSANERQILVCTDTELLFVDSATGIIQDRQRFSELGNTGILQTGSTVVFGTSSGQAIGHNITAGVKLWGRTVSGPIDYTPVGAETPTGRVAFVASRTGDAMVIDARRGGLIGRMQMFKGPGSAPISGGGSFYVASLDQSFYAFDARTASQRWRIRTSAPITGQPTYHDGTVYCELPGDGLVAIDSSSGSRRWASAEITGEVIGVRGGRLVVWDAATRTAASLDPGTGGVRGRVKLDSIDSMFCEPFQDGNLYTVSDAAVLAKFAPNS